MSQWVCLDFIHKNLEISHILLIMWTFKCTNNNLFISKQFNFVSSLLLLDFVLSFPVSFFSFQTSLITILSFYRLIPQETPCFRQLYDRKVQIFLKIYFILNRIHKVKIIFNILYLTAILSNGYYIIPYEMFESVRVAFTSPTFDALFTVDVHTMTHNHQSSSLSLLSQV